MHLTPTTWTPNTDQQQAIDTMDGLCIVMAGPGTGKTNTLAAKTAAIVAAGGRPLAVTYTRAAAHELATRLGTLHVQATACTCHSLAFRIFSCLTAHQPHASRLLDPRRHEREAILRAVGRRLAGHAHLSRSQPASLHDLGDRIHRLKIAGPHTQEDATVLAWYEEAKGPARMDFQDLLIWTARLLAECPDLLLSYQERYTQVLVDEAQDLDPLQARFVALFVPPHNALTLFLDPDQAIYGYAGAHPEDTLTMFQHLTPRTVITLRPTYRSRAPIVQCALSLIAHNPNGQHSRQLTPTRTGSHRPRWVRVRTPEDEARVTVRTIQVLVAHNVSPSDILCLFRSNAYRVSLEIGLTRARIPFGHGQSHHDQRPVYLEYSVVPLTAFLLLARGQPTLPWAEEAALRVYVGHQLAAQLARREQTMLEDRAQALGERVLHRVQQYRRDLATLQACQHLSPCRIGEMAAALLSRISRRPADDPGLVNAAQHALRTFPSLTAFAEHMQTLEALHHTPASARVTLSTIHRAKGRQSRVVFLLGASEGHFPLTHDGVDIAEERRLCFVGSTRASDLFILLSPRLVGGHHTPPSRFLREGGFTRLFFPTVRRLITPLTKG